MARSGLTKSEKNAILEKTLGEEYTSETNQFVGSQYFSEMFVKDKKSPAQSIGSDYNPKKKVASTNPPGPQDRTKMPVQNVKNTPVKRKDPLKGPVGEPTFNPAEFLKPPKKVEGQVNNSKDNKNSNPEVKSVTDVSVEKVETQTEKKLSTDTLLLLGGGGLLLLLFGVYLGK